MTTKEKLIAAIDRLSQEQQDALLALAEGMQSSKLPPPTSGQAFVDNLKNLDFEPGDVDEMWRAIQEADKIDWAEWE